MSNSNKTKLTQNVENILKLSNESLINCLTNTDSSYLTLWPTVITMFLLYFMALFWFCKRLYFLNFI